MVRDTGVEKKSQRLAGKKIAWGVCGGIGSVETVKMIRELRRHDAEITVFLTPSASRFITPLSLAWAAGRPVLETVNAEVDHLDFYDWVVLAPATLNTLAKIAVGICDNPVTLLAASQLGRGGKIGIVPAMNEALARHPNYPSIRSCLTEWGAVFSPPLEEEGRWKMPSPDVFTRWFLEVCHGA